MRTEKEQILEYIHAVTREMDTRDYLSVIMEVVKELDDNIEVVQKELIERDCESWGVS